MFLLNSRSSHLTAISSSTKTIIIIIFKPRSKKAFFTKNNRQLYLRFYKRKKHSFSRSYRVIWPSSFSIILSNALIYSIQPPVSVYGTVIATLYIFFSCKNNKKFKCYLSQFESFIIFSLKYKKLIIITSNSIDFYLKYPFIITLAILLGTE